MSSEWLIGGIVLFRCILPGIFGGEIGRGVGFLFAGWHWLGRDGQRYFGFDGSGERKNQIAKSKTTEQNSKIINFDFCGEILLFLLCLEGFVEIII